MQNEVAFDERRYRRRVLWAVLAILFFILVYCLLLAVAGAISVLVTIFGWQLVIIHPHWILVGLTLGLTAFGLFLLYILLRFLIESEREDDSLQIEVSEKEEPRLYAMIAETAAAAGCKMPVKVFLSPQVNASMSFSASVAGLIFPLRKRLTIGLGLMEALSVTELKAVLAHEFGHYSQKSMRVGAYVYQVNRILHSVLVLRESDIKVVEKLQNAPWIFSLAGVGAKGAFFAVRWILTKVYAVVNLAYLALSREMEFHADKAAAEVTGAQALSRALTRVHLVTYAERSLFSFYERRIPEAVKTENIYPQLYAVMHFYGELGRMEMIAGLPQVLPVTLSKFNRSKLVFNNQWESHPSTADRLKALNVYAAEVGPNIVEPSVTLLDHPDKWQAAATTQVFRNVKYDKPTTQLSKDEFVTEMLKEHEEAAVDLIYNGYYDEKVPLKFSVEDAAKATGEPSSLEELFSDEVVDSLYDMFALGNDMEVLRQVALPTSGIKTFDYDGQRFKSKEAGELVTVLEAKEEAAIATYKENDVRIFQTALFGARKAGLGEEFVAVYQSFFALLERMETENKFIHELRVASAFFSETHPVEKIPNKIKELQKLEKSLVAKLREMRDSPTFQPHLDESSRKELEAYLAIEQRYFLGNAYDQTALRRFYSAMDIFVMLLKKQVDQERKALLKLQAQHLRASQ